MSETIFKAEKIVKQYQRFHFTKLRFHKFYALNKVDMEIHRGDIYGFVGQNGAGKTTLIRILAGLVTPGAGEVELFGKSDSKALYRQRSRIGGIIEAPAFYPGLTARDNLEICRLQRGIKDKSCIEKALRTVGLQESEIDRVKVKNFSLGMKQRLGIAIALLGRPEFLFFDEPLNGLDPVGIRDFRKLVQRLNQEFGITVLISSHLLRELNELATCYGFIHKGKMIEQISAKDLEEKLDKFLILRVDDAVGAEKILRTTLGLNRLEVVSHSTIYLREQLERDGEIMKALVTAGITVKEMTVKEEDLEKYYLSLIRNR